MNKKTKDLLKNNSEKRKKEIDKIAKKIHPHDDEPDPNVNMGNYNFTQMLFAFCLGFVTMFVLAVDEINDFKGCYYESLDYWIKEKS
tara:strand:- start:267 stop:527 length:261 start_codon:yes stop_codon:yes gene_type:complete